MNKKIIQIVAIIALVAMLLTLLPVFVNATENPSEATNPSTAPNPSQPSAPPESSVPPTTVDDSLTVGGAKADYDSGVVMVYAPEMEATMKPLQLKVSTNDTHGETLAGNLLAKKFDSFLLPLVYKIELFNADGTPAQLPQSVGLDIPLVPEVFLDDPKIFYIDLETDTAIDLNATMNDDMITMHVISDSLGYFALVGNIQNSPKISDYPLWWIVPVVIVLLIGVGIGIYLIFSKDRAKAKKTDKPKKNSKKKK